MKVRYITEGVFKTKEQILKVRAKEKEMSNQERVAGVASKVIGEKIDQIIKMIVQNKEICPFDADMFSCKIEETHNLYSQVELSKKDVYSYLEEGENGKKVIHLSFDFGMFVLKSNWKDVKSDKACAKLKLSSWDIARVNKLNKRLFATSVSTKIKNYINKRLLKPGMKDNEVCNLILDSKIVVDNIYMYTKQNEFDKLTFVLSDDHYTHPMMVKYFVNNEKRNINKIMKKFKTEEIILQNLAEFIDFGIPIEIEMKLITHSPSTTLASIPVMFPGYNTLGDLEKAAGAEGVFMDCTKYYMSINKFEMSDYDYNTFEYKIDNCSYIIFNYEDTFYGEYVPGQGFVYNRAELPKIKSIMFSDNRDKYLSRTYVSVGYRSAEPNMIVYVISEDKLYFTIDGPLERRRRLNECPVSIAVDDKACYDKVQKLVDYVAELLGPIK